MNSSSDEWQSESRRIVSVTTSPTPFGFVSLAFFLLLHDSKSDTPINIYNIFFILKLKHINPYIMLQAARLQLLPAPSLLQSFQTSYHLSIYAPRCSHATSCATLCSGIISTEVHRNRHNLLYYFIHPRVVININLFSILFPNNYLM